jgi:hypothetical protein
MLSVIILNVVMLSVVVANIWVYLKHLRVEFCKYQVIGQAHLHNFEKPTQL